MALSTGLQKVRQAPSLLGVPVMCRSQGHGGGLSQQAFLLYPPTDQLWRGRQRASPKRYEAQAWGGGPF